MYANGQQHQVPLITGINGNEGSLLTGQIPMDDVAAFEGYVRSTYASVADQAIAHYGVSSAEEAKAGLDHLFHDMLIAGPVRTLATHHAKTASPVWLYHFSRVPPTAMGTTLGSHHAAEIAYVFGNLIDHGREPVDGRANPMTEGEWTEVDRRVSAGMMDYWVQFAATGNPNRDGLSQWPEFDAADKHLTFGDTLEPGTGLHAAGFELYDAYQVERRTVAPSR